MKRIILTGGGTAGHVTPNIALIPRLKELSYDIHYIGSLDGIEKELIDNIGIPYYGISSGKLRRYFDMKNFTDPIRIIKGFHQAKNIIKELKPNVLFSKGGFVTVPVVLAAKEYKVPSIIHESDMTPGLANKICIPAASKVCCNFPETLQYLPQEKAAFTGSPIRKELLQGNKFAALDICHFTINKPTMLVIGGSLGASAINHIVRTALPSLLERFQVIHLCGKNKIEDSLNHIEVYAQFEYVTSELRDLFALADIVISRAGANAICEILALQKPNLLIPLPASSSRGDQLLNAASFKEQGFSIVLQEEEITEEVFLTSVNQLYTHRLDYIATMRKSNQLDAVEKIIQLIMELSI